jgi:CHAT domain-containing protein
MVATMPISHAEPARLHCPNCRQENPSEVLTIVDGAERPDLLALAGRCDADSGRKMIYYQRNPPAPSPFSHPFYWAAFYFTGA